MDTTTSSTPTTTCASTSATRILSRAGHIVGVQAATVQIGAHGVDVSCGSDADVEILRSALELARALRVHCSSTRVRVEFDRSVIVADIYENGMVAVMLPIGGPAMKSLNRSLRRAWKSG
jgi:hypothetical protein